MNNLTIVNLRKHLLTQGWNTRFPLVLSLDCDRTIIDRNQGAHKISPKLKHSFQDLKKSNKIIPLINTGRDEDSYHPIASQIMHTSPCLFVSGRILKTIDIISSFPEARLDLNIKMALWNALINRKIPFLDTKSSQGNIFFCSNPPSFRHYFAHYKPLDWFNGITPKIIDFESSQAFSYFCSLDIVRAEIPILTFPKDELFKAVQNKDKITTRLLLAKLLELRFIQEDLMLIPVLSHLAKKRDMADIASIRLMVSNKTINKGFGTKKFLELQGIPPSNLIVCGDSAGPTASDVIIKELLPKATLCIMANARTEAKEKADFIVPSVEQDGAAYLFELLEQLII